MLSKIQMIPRIFLIKHVLNKYVLHGLQDKVPLTDYFVSKVLLAMKKIEN